MSDTSKLKPGSFYWVQIAFDPDATEEWENREMPARYVGVDEHGNELWNYLGVEGVAQWATRYIGPEIIFSEAIKAKP